MPKNKQENDNDYLIRPQETKKNNIKQRPAMEEGIIMRHPSISIFVGSVGSGKSTLVINLLSKHNLLGKDKETNKPYFDEIFVFTGSDDDLYDNLIDMNIIKKNKIKIDPTPEDIGKVIKLQRKEIAEKGIDKSAKVLIILDDVADNAPLLRSPELKTLFIKPRQLNICVFLLAQYMMLIPKFMRNNAQNIFFFRGNRSDHEILAEQFCPSNMDKKTFLKLIDQCVNDRGNETHNFMHINRRKPLESRFRRNLNKIIKIK